MSIFLHIFYGALYLSALLKSSLYISLSRSFFQRVPGSQHSPVTLQYPLILVEGWWNLMPVQA